MQVERKIVRKQQMLRVNSTAGADNIDSPIGTQNGVKVVVIPLRCHTKYVGRNDG